MDHIILTHDLLERSFFDLATDPVLRLGNRNRYFRLCVCCLEASQSLDRSFLLLLAMLFKLLGLQEVHRDEGELADVVPFVFVQGGSSCSRSRRVDFLPLSGDAKRSWQCLIGSLNLPISLPFL